MEKTVVCPDMDGQLHTVPVSQLRWRPSAYGIVIHDGKLLVSPQYNGYDLPGGGVDLGELPEVAVVREVEEETGITVANPRLLTCHSSFFKLPQSDEGEFIQSILMYYQCEYVGGELSDAHFTEAEKIFSRFPEWLPLDQVVAEVEKKGLASSFDWRETVMSIAAAL